ncbi:hypothetical protein X759_14130 [Mesorhizobium sp. LSHC420B00]|uniref:hypothetical protein n=1 Tax=unclassified Mesorhizobium TaxID=325217 RepID=UPI0003CF5D51|nr:hypothetical protein [Mesorhizobium sp. LSHC420B00]ESX80268.1 hypothetical protein X759_14130 [Mesorhizobium sp. LSHC420B00]
MLSSEQIAKAKLSTPYGLKEGSHHEHDDCIRIAYEWLDAQMKTKGVVQRSRALKHMIEKWGGRYVSQSDVEVAAHIHPEIFGAYPRYNISARLVQPNDARLEGISEAKTQDYSMRQPELTYKSKE